MPFSRGEDVLRTATLDAPASSLTLRRAAAVVLATALVTAAARVTLPLPGTPVPFTLQPLAVLVVGGLLGPWLGAASLALYLALGAAGLPVFTPSVVLPYGAARLIGPTGGYLLAYPIAAYAVGRLAGDTRAWGRVILAVFAGLVLIHLGGLTQLALLTGSLDQAARFGALPFLVNDAIKLGIAAVTVHGAGSAVRTRL